MNSRRDLDNKPLPCRSTLHRAVRGEARPRLREEADEGAVRAPRRGVLAAALLERAEHARAVGVVSRAHVAVDHAVRRGERPLPEREVRRRRLQRKERRQLDEHERQADARDDRRVRGHVDGVDGQAEAGRERPGGERRGQHRERLGRGQRRARDLSVPVPRDRHVDVARDLLEDELIADGLAEDDPRRARTQAVPTFGWPAKGYSSVGVKIRTRAVFRASSGGSTKVISA